MRKTFLFWMLLFMAGAFVVAFFATFYLQTNQAAENAKSLIFLKVDDLIDQLEINQKNLQEIRAESDSNALAKARAFARIIEIDPSTVTSILKMDLAKRALDVDELHVSDENGILVGSTQQAYIGYDFAADPQSAAFMPAITDKDFELAQDPQPKGINKQMFQYVGVARRDAPGIVQIGNNPERLYHAMQVADIKNLAPGFRVGKSGSVMITDLSGTILSTGEEAFLEKPLDEYGLPMAQFSQNEGSFFSETKKMMVAYKRTGDYLIVGQLPDTEMYLDRDNSITVLIAFNALLFAVIFILIATLVQRIVISGIQKVNRSLKKITDGDLDEVVNVSTNAEFRSLSGGINSTVGALKEAIKEVASKIDAELAFANAVQLSVLPTGALSSGHGCHVHGDMFAAKKIGGDFYDYFLIDNHRLCFVIADVSDKGIPAALFMMQSKSLIKSFALTGLGVEEIFFRANNALCENNGANMFVTAFIGILNLNTGALEYCNAGHNPPLIKKADGLYERLPSKRGFVLAGMADVPYAKSQTMLQAGDMLFLYTDGVTEAMNHDGQLYGEARMTDYLNKFNADMKLPDMISAVKADVDRFADGAEQADDITMLAVQFSCGQTAD